MTFTKRWGPLAAVSLGTFMLLVDVTIVNVALPVMASDLGASFTGLQWVVDAYALALAAVLLAVGALADRRGRRATYLAGLAGFTLASLACGLAPSPGVLIAARGVQGVAAAAMFATTIALLGGAYAGRDRGVAFGVWGAVAGAAAALGPLMGGALTQALSWRWIFFVNLPVGLLTVVLARRTLAESREPAGARPDVAGAAAFTVAAAAATTALIRVHDAGWGSAGTLGLLALAAAALAAFAAVERRSPAPILDLALLRRGAFAGVLAGAVLLSLSAFAALTYVSLWLQTAQGLSPIGAGLVVLPMPAAAFVVSALAGRFLHGGSGRAAIAGGLLAIGAGDLLHASLGAGSSWSALLAGLAVSGVGVGLATPTLVSAALAAVPPERAGMAAGAVNTARQLGLALGIALLGSLYGTPRGSAAAGALATTFVGAGAAGVAAAPAGARYSPGGRLTPSNGRTRATASTSSAP
jgi:EmrB/QacA subfamily drug resistance transporter